MEAFAFYLIKSMVWLTGFALVYVMFLRNERFFKLNRIYLISGMLVSIIFPLFTWHYTVVLPVVPTLEVFEPQLVGTTVVNEPFPKQSILLFIYLAGAIYLLFRVIRQTFAVYRVIRKSEILPFNTAKLIRTTEYPASFSFFSFVFVNPSTTDTETNEIVNHELEHIRQQHWIDLLLFEILCILQWFNPVNWLYGRFIRQNHEYLADERALQRSSNPAIYRAALLNQMFGGPVISLANSFNYSLNKKRFNMMKHTINSPIRKLKLLIVLPLMAGVFYAFSAPEYQFIQSEEHAINLNQNEKTVKGRVVNEEGKPLKGASIVVSGKTIGTTTDANGNFKLEMPDDSPIVISYVGFGSQKVNPNFEKEMVITMKIEIIGIDAMGNEANSSQPLNSDVHFSKMNDISNYFEERNLQPLLIIDGVIAENQNIDQIDAENIEAINIIKDDISSTKYGDKGKNGVVEITLKKDDKTKAAQTFKVQSNSPFKFGNSNGSGNQPLIVKDGVIVENKIGNDIPPETIESINVLKGESATALFGQKGKNGVVLITTKIGALSPQNGTTEVNVTGNASDQKENKANAGIQMRSTGTSGIESKPLIVIDGVIAENQNLEKIDPENIESMSVLKDESATKKYGEKGKNGVIEITSKSKTPFIFIEEMPEFPGGVEALKTYVSSTMNYPTIALQNGIQGQVFVKFFVGKDGSVTDAKIDRGVDPSLDKEALRIVNNMPKWKPGSQNGDVVRVSYSLPINFAFPFDYKIIKEKLRTKSAEVSKETEERLNQRAEIINQQRASIYPHKLIIVPNQTKDQATITLEGSDYKKKLTVTIYGIDGKLFKKETKSGPTFSLSLASLTSGTYLIVADDGTNQFSGQIVVNH